jgi:nitrogen fixation protein FixH
MTRELNGRHVLAIAAGAFAVILGANIAMLVAAVGSFPGLVVKNSYVASQGWNERTAAQAALGWKTAISHNGERLFVRVRDKNGLPVQGLALSARLGRPSSDAEDRLVLLTAAPDGYSAEARLSPGIWRVDLTAPDYPVYAQQTELFVQGPQ